MAPIAHNTSLPHAADAVLETVCQRGCRYVLQTIDRMERGEAPAEVAVLTLSERQAVLAELRSIMAVYGGAHSAERAQAPPAPRPPRHPAHTGRSPHR
jgi:hypothetical protein